MQIVLIVQVWVRTLTDHGGASCQPSTCAIIEVIYSNITQKWHLHVSVGIYSSWYDQLSHCIYHFCIWWDVEILPNLPDV